MQNRTPARPAVPSFTPVPRKYRHDGWTPDRQRAFIAALADTGGVGNAARSVNMSPEGAYALRRQPGAESFAAAWEAALDHGVTRLRDTLMERAIEGVPVPIMHGGEQVAERRVYNDRLGMFILRHHDPKKYGEPGGSGKRNGASPSTRKALKREFYEEQRLLRQAEEADIRGRILDKIQRLEAAIPWYREQGMDDLADETEGMVRVIWLRIEAMSDYRKERDARRAAMAARGETPAEADDDSYELAERYAPDDEEAEDEGGPQQTSARGPARNDGGEEDDDAQDA